MNLKNNRFFWIGVLIICFAIGISLFFVLFQKKQSPTQSELSADYFNQIKILLQADTTIDTSDWKDYSSKDFSLKIKIPPNYRISSDSELSNSESLYVTSLSKEEEKKLLARENQREGSEPLSPAQYGIFIHEYTNETNLDLEQWLKKEYVKLSDAYSEEIETHKIHKAQKDFLFIYDTSGLSHQLSTALKYRDKVYIFSTLTSSQDPPNMKDEFDFFKIFVMAVEFL